MDGLLRPLAGAAARPGRGVAGDDKTTALGLVTAIGALVAVLVGPIAGALSDATTARPAAAHLDRGRRARGLRGLAPVDPGQRCRALILAGVREAGLNALQAGLTATVPDPPVRQRGWSPAGVGPDPVDRRSARRPAGHRGGERDRARVPVDRRRRRDRRRVLPVILSRPAEPRQRRGDRSGPAATAFRFSPRENPDFAWAWGTRFLVQLGNAMATLYLLYFLRDQVRYEQLFPGQNAGDGLLILILIYTAATVLTVVAGGVISDRTGRRKPSVIASGLVMAVAAGLLAFWPTWPGALVAAAVLGLGFGVYLSVDQALITQVLPAADDRAKDLGIINIANSAPQVLGPALAAPIVALGGYRSLFLAVAAVTIAGSILVTRIKSVA